MTVSELRMEKSTTKMTVKENYSLNDAATSYCCGENSERKGRVQS